MNVNLIRHFYHRTRNCIVPLTAGDLRLRSKGTDPDEATVFMDWLCNNKLAKRTSSKSEDVFILTNRGEERLEEVLYEMGVWK